MKRPGTPDLFTLAHTGYPPPNNRINYIVAHLFLNVNS